MSWSFDYFNLQKTIRTPSLLNFFVFTDWKSLYRYEWDIKRILQQCSNQMHHHWTHYYRKAFWRWVKVGQVRYDGIRRSSASPRPPCDSTSPAFVWPSPRQTQGPSCPYPSDRNPPDATMKLVDAPSAWTSPSDLVKKNPMRGILRRESRHMPIEALLALAVALSRCLVFVSEILFGVLPIRTVGATVGSLL